MQIVERGFCQGAGQGILGFHGGAEAVGAIQAIVERVRSVVPGTLVSSLETSEIGS